MSLRAGTNSQAQRSILRHQCLERFPRPPIVVATRYECANLNRVSFCLINAGKTEWEMQTINKLHKIIEELKNEDHRSKLICTYLDRNQFVSGQLSKHNDII